MSPASLTTVLLLALCSAEAQNLESVLEVYSPWRLTQALNIVADPGNSTGGDVCRSHLRQYVEGTADGKLWALKMWDSGGRYSSGFFWGNFYWLGSAALCRTLSSDSEAKIEEKSSSGMDSAISRTDTAPFPTGFYVLKVQFNVSRQITPNVRSQLLGVCLPLSCGPREVEEVVGAGARLEDQGGPGYDERFNGSSVYPDWRGRLEVRLVKAPQTAYDMMRDPLFWTLVVVSCGVLLMVLAGTLFDFWSELCSNLGCGAKSRFHYINYAFNLGGHPPSLNQNGKRSARVTPAVTVTGPPDGTSPTTDNHKMTIPRGNNNESVG